MLPPQDVANAFVKHYYAFLKNSPQFIHRLYRESSLLSWPGTNGDVTPVTTLLRIKRKIMSSDYKNCSAEVKTGFSRVCGWGGIVISVTGSLTNNNNNNIAKKNFNQIFVLAKQRTEGFFVLNDILRVFDAAPNHAGAILPHLFTVLFLAMILIAMSFSIYISKTIDN